MADLGYAVFEWPGYDTDISELLRLCALLCLAFVWGQAMHLVFRVPAHVAELFGGFVLGPSLLDIVPYTDALRLLGVLGMLMLGFQAGLGAKFHTFRWAWLVQTAVALLCSSSAIFLGALALELGPSHLPFIEGVAGGVSVCAASSSASIYAAHPRSRAGQAFVGSVAVLESSMCLTAFTIVRSLVMDWGWADVTQPAVSAVVLCILSFALRRAVPLLAAVLSRPPSEDGKSQQQRWPGGMLFIMLASIAGGCALAESIRSSMLLAAILAGSVFVGFVIPRHEWKTADSVLGGLVLLAFTVIAKCLISLVVVGLGWPGHAVKMAIQVSAALAVPSETNFYVAILLYSQFVLSPRGMASVLWCLVIMSLLAPLALLGTALGLKQETVGLDTAHSPKIRSRSDQYAMKSTVDYADAPPRDARGHPGALCEQPPSEKPAQGSPKYTVARPLPPLPLGALGRPLPAAPQRLEPPAAFAVPLNPSHVHPSSPNPYTSANPASSPLDSYAAQTLPHTLEATPDARFAMHGEPPRRRSPHTYSALDGYEAPPPHSSPPPRYRQVLGGAGML